jgi:hypothetical protein
MAKDQEMEVLRARRYPSANPGIGMSTAIPACSDFDLKEVEGKIEGVFKVPKPGNCVGRDGNY